MPQPTHTDHGFHRHWHVDRLFVNGDHTDSIYLLEKNRNNITDLSEDGHEVLHEINRPGQIFGETSTILGIPRTTSAQALKSSLLRDISRKSFGSLLDDYP